MSYAIAFPTSQTEHSEAKDNAHRTAVFLSRLSNLFKSDRFHAFIASNESQFEWATKRLFDRLRKDLFFQVAQGCNLRVSEEVSHSRQLWLTSAICDAEVQRLTETYGLKLKKKDTGFVVPRSASFEEEVFKLLQSRPTAPRIKDTGRPFYLWNSIDAVLYFIEARRTLAQPTGHAKLDHLLEGLDEEYLLSGYPHDILVHDVKTILSRPGKVLGLLMRKEWCSTWTIEDKNDTRLHEPGFQFVPLT